jgi:hypothetical protein
VYDVDYYYLGRIIKKEGVIKDVKYTYTFNNQLRIQPVADEIKINNSLTKIVPHKIKYPKFDYNEYNRWVYGNKESKKGKLNKTVNK